MKIKYAVWRWLYEFQYIFLKDRKEKKNSLFGHFSCSEWENTGQGKRIFWHVLHCVTVKSQEEM